MSTEKLIVKNFLNLDDIELEVKKINIIIGRQAEGKSILAKLVFFFRDCFLDYYRQHIYPKNRQNCEKKARDKFRKIFPVYTWKNTNFLLIYQYQNYSIEVNSQGQINYSETFQEKLEELMQYFPDDEYEFLYAARQQLDFLEETAIFIPAGRSFFATLESNIFSLIAEDIDIDYFLKRFGAYYERIKRSYESTDLGNREVYNLMNKILRGNYIREKEIDCLISEQTNHKINLSNASSGQQETLPMLLILTTICQHHITDSFLRLFIFIEEPEAHLFPTSQRDMINLIGSVFNITNKQNRFFITTHTPYVLTAFNNLIQAGNTRKAIQKRDNSQKNLEKLYALVPKEQILEIEDIGAYMLENGKVKTIIDPENQIIDAQIIDEVSNQIVDTFQELVDLEIEE